MYIKDLKADTVLNKNQPRDIKWAVEETPLHNIAHMSHVLTERSALTIVMIL